MLVTRLDDDDGDDDALYRVLGHLANVQTHIFQHLRSYILKIGISKAQVHGPCRCLPRRQQGPANGASNSAGA